MSSSQGIETASDFNIAATNGVPYNQRAAAVPA
jgi:hypothetical protein